MTRWQFTGFDPDDGAAEYIDEFTGEAYYTTPRRDSPLRYATPLDATQRKDDPTMNDEPKRSVTIDMANRFGMEPGPFEQVLRATVVPHETTKEQFAAFLLVAKRYNLDPITREIYAFPTRAGGIQPIVGIDGWLRIINDHPQLDGIEFKDHLLDDGNLAAVTCRIYRKDRAHPVELTEYLIECQRPTEAWNKWPARMLRHKALIQCARYAFGLSGIVEPDEFERFNDDGTIIRKKPDATAPRDSTSRNSSRLAAAHRDATQRNDIEESSPMAAPKKVPMSTQPDPKTDVATSAEAYQLGREAHAKGAGKLAWPGFWKDKINIESWMRGWSAAEDEMTSARAVDDETSRGND
jgi:phage recombination protein Bet